jgi:hypothetical protein
MSAPLFRNRSGALYSSDTLDDDFRDIRRMELGPEESRTLADFRRSGTQEAFAGDAMPADVSHAMGNTVATSNVLFATYHHLPVEGARGPDRGAPDAPGAGPDHAAGARSEGPRGNRMRPKSRNTSARKVGTAGPHPAKSVIYGGSDGARTRDLRRDGPTNYPAISRLVPTFCPSKTTEFRRRVGTLFFYDLHQGRLVPRSAAGRSPPAMQPPPQKRKPRHCDQQCRGATNVPHA